MEGFAKILRGQNTCGIANCATYPIYIVDPYIDKYRLFSRKLHDPATTGAMCLDGSPSGMYYSKGYGDGVNKTIIFFDGGGWCYGYSPETVLKDCSYRATTYLGSTDPNVTDHWAPDATNFINWYYNDISKDDINFYNWNRFFFIYCDGTGHQGYVKDGKMGSLNKTVYFRGHNNTQAHLDFIFSLLPPELTDSFVVNGCSAGGLATYTWMDTIA